MFSAATYSSRRKILRDRLQHGVVLLLGNEDSPMNYADNTFHFRQDSTFLYYFGIDRPHLAAVMDLDAGTEIVFGDELSIDDVVWTGTLPTVREQSLAVGVDRTESWSRLAEFLAAARARGRQVHALPPYRAEHRLKLLELLGLEVAEQAAAMSIELVRAVAAQRLVKSDEELKEIESAVDISVDMHVAAIRMARPGMIEAELAAEAHRIALAAGGQLSFPIIMTTQGQTLHNHHHGNILRSGDMVLCDCGAETALHYAGDLSSTLPVNPTFTPRQREIYELTLLAHETAVAALAPGVAFLDIHLEACTVIARGLIDLGLMKGNASDAVAAGAHAMFFPCGLGHLMGLDIHDMENFGEVEVGYAGEPKSQLFGLKSLRLGRKLEPGFVLTIEPGIYFIPELIDLWRGESRHSEFVAYDRLESFRSFGGIRNEENFVVTEHGHRRLGKAKPKTVSEVEALR